MPLRKSGYESAPDVCGNLVNPGRGLDNQAEVDYTGKHTTIDQSRIEDHLAGMDLGGRALLHIGVGNSSLARRLAARACRIDGTTVDVDEKDRGEALGLPNYRVFLLNKHAKEMLLLPERYDFIIDNNPASFVCCKYHFYLMLDNYLTRLRPGGRILTDQRGLGWTVDGNDEWKLSYADLVGLERKFPLRVGRLTDSIYYLESTVRTADVTPVNGSAVTSRHSLAGS